MKPETPSPHLSPEQPSISYNPGIERAPKSVSPEIGVEIGTERYEQKAETNAAISDISFSTIPPTPVVDDSVVADNTTIGDTPAVANDDDLIEKEWVDKAKKIVAETKDNPHQRDKSVNKLKVVYLEKRYGRELGVAK